jgi:hypothetical protein
MSSWLHERLGVVSTIDPANLNNATNNGDYVDMSKFHEIIAVLQLGAIDSTVDFSLRQADDVGGTNEAAVSGKSITQLTGGTQDNNTYVISLKSEELTGSGRYVRPRVTMGNGTSNFGCVLVLGVPRFGPATDDDLAQVAQGVS